MSRPARPKPVAVIGKRPVPPPLQNLHYRLQVFSLTYCLHPSIRAGWVFGSTCRPGRFSLFPSRLSGFTRRRRREVQFHLDILLLAVLETHDLLVSNGAVEGMNNKIKSISHRSFGFRSAKNFIAAIYHCCARLPLPVER
jgi:cellulose synthase/poly-beta-1,6-N-acetylglucosamine synthase-like glycosyltransferase